MYDWLCTFFLFQSNRRVIDCPVCSWSFKAWLFVTVGLSCNNTFSKHRLCLWVDRVSCAWQGLVPKSPARLPWWESHELGQHFPFPPSLLHFPVGTNASHSLWSVTKLKISKRREKAWFFYPYITLLIFCYFSPLRFPSQVYK